MLGSHWRIVLHNQLGVTIDANKLTLRYRGRYFGSDNKLAFGAAVTNFANQTAPVVNNAYHASSPIDNAVLADPSIEADVEALLDLVTNTGVPDGTFTLWLQRSLNGTTWPENGEGQELRTIRRDSQTNYDAVLPIS